MATRVSTKRRVVTSVVIIGAALLQPRAGYAQNPSSYDSMAPIEQYRMSPADEIALARSAAPAAVSSAAEILVLGTVRYESAVRGLNGFVCLVERSWTIGFDKSEFWNPRTRSPMCFNSAAARSVLPVYLRRTEAVLSGVSRGEMQRRLGTSVTGTRGLSIAAGAMCYMQSKSGYLGDNVGGPWHPHLMFFLPATSAAAWGANLEHSPVFLPDSTSDIWFTTFVVPVPRWSDGTRDSVSSR